MGEGLVANEDSRKVFLRGVISSVRRRSYATSQELGSPSFLPDFRRNSEFPRRRNQFDNRIQRRLFRDGIRPARQSLRPLGRIAVSHFKATKITNTTLQLFGIFRA